MIAANGSCTGPPGAAFAPVDNDPLLLAAAAVPTVLVLLLLLLMEVISPLLLLLLLLLLYIAPATNTPSGQALPCRGMTTSCC
jgi:uncharacterized membrane protein YraQ (UPF0718 family)